MLRRIPRALCSLPSTSHATTTAFRRQLAAPAALNSLEPNVMEKPSLPSANFVKQRIRGVRNKERLASLATEIEVFREFFGPHSLPSITDDHWSLFFDMVDSDERCDFLLSLYKEKELEGVRNSYDNKSLLKTSEVNQKRYDAGEIVYAPGFNEFINLRGQEFRAIIDRVYGARLLGAVRSQEEKKLVVDCRYMTDYSYAVQKSFLGQLQDLHEYNWTSRWPFELSLANMKPDKQLAELMKRHFLFRYGPPRLQHSAEKPFTPHPLSPSISARGLRDIIAKDGKDSIMYVSWSSTRPAPELPPDNLRTLVLCASSDLQPWSSSLSAATSDGLPAYRIPYEKYIRFQGAKKSLPMRSVAAVLGDWILGSGWERAISGNIVQKERSISQEQKRRIVEGREREQIFKIAVRDLNILRRKEETEHRKTGWNPLIGKRLGEANPTAESRVRRHRYSRAERNARNK